MFSPAKAITAGALVFAIGGALLIAQPVQQPSSLPGVETETEPAVPVEFTGRWGYGPPLQGEQVAFEEGVGTYQGGAWRQTVSEVTDPRFDGDVVIFANHTTWPDGDVWNQAFRVQNDDGAWQSEPTYGVGFSELFESDAPLTSVFHGEGGYEGLTAIVELHWWDTGNGWDLWGVIFDGGLPPDPEPVPFE